MICQQSCLTAIQHAFAAVLLSLCVPVGLTHGVYTLIFASLAIHFSVSNNRNWNRLLKNTRLPLSHIDELASTSSLFACVYLVLGAVISIFFRVTFLYHYVVREKSWF